MGGNEGTPAGGGLFGGGSTGGTAGLFGEVLPEQVDNSKYTPLDQLTQEELAAFQAELFEPGMIPERPPPRELCV